MQHHRVTGKTVVIAHPLARLDRVELARGVVHRDLGHQVVARAGQREALQRDRPAGVRAHGELPGCGDPAEHVLVIADGVLRDMPLS